MGGFAWLLLAGVASFWLSCSVIVAMVGVATHRHDRRVVIPDPHELPSHQLAWDRLRAAVLEAKVDLERERTDFTTREREVRARPDRSAA